MLHVGVDPALVVSDLHKAEFSVKFQNLWISRVPSFYKIKAF
jgi:hypothetical protein